MTQSFDTNDSSVPKDGTADQPDRYAHGSDQLAELKARLTLWKDDAQKWSLEYCPSKNPELQQYYSGRFDAFRIAFQLIDVFIEANNANICEDTKSNS